MRVCARAHVFACVVRDETHRQRKCEKVSKRERRSEKHHVVVYFYLLLLLKYDVWKVLPPIQPFKCDMTH